MSAKLEDIQKELQDAVRKQLEREMSTISRLVGPMRKGHYGEVPPAVAAAYSSFSRRWWALIAEGEELGLLSYTYGEGYDLGEPRREWVWDETEEEFEARKKRESCDVGSGGHVVFPVSKGPSR